MRKMSAFIDLKVEWVFLLMIKLLSLSSLGHICSPNPLLYKSCFMFQFVSSTWLMIPCKTEWKVLPICIKKKLVKDFESLLPRNPEVSPSEKASHCVSGKMVDPTLHYAKFGSGFGMNNSQLGHDSIYDCIYESIYDSIHHSIYDSI